MYGFDESTSTTSGGKYISQVGVVAPLKISALAAVKDDNGCYLNVEVMNKQNQTASRRYYEPVLGKAGINTEEDLTKAKTKIVKICKNISDQFLPANYSTGQQPDFYSFLNKMIGDIGTKLKEQELRAILVFNTHGFVTLRSFCPIFEKTSVAEASSQLKLTQWDNVVQPEGPMSAAEINSTVKTGLDTLPF